MIDIDENYLLLAGQNHEPEIFYTIEGEGEYIGQPSVFLRLFGCNLTCKAFASADSPNGCDSYVSWSVKNKLSFRQVFNLMEEQQFITKLERGAIFKYTGGEPMIRQDKMLLFTQAFIERYWFIPRIDFETNATIKPDDRWVTDYKATFTTSPKLSTNGDSRDKTFKPDVLRWHRDNGSGFKFVITQSEDLDEIWRKYVNDEEDINIPVDRIWLMPCAGSREEHVERAEAVAEYAKALNVKFSPRLHLLLWNKATRV